MELLYIGEWFKKIVNIIRKAYDKNNKNYHYNSSIKKSDNILELWTLFNDVDSKDFFSQQYIYL